MQNDVVHVTGFVVVEENFILNVHFGNFTTPYMLFY